MSTELTFKTNIKCNGCIAAVKPFLDKIEGANWNVDLENPDRILHVHGPESLQAEDIIQALKEAGYQATESQE